MQKPRRRWRTCARFFMRIKERTCHDSTRSLIFFACDARGADWISQLLSLPTRLFARSGSTRVPDTKSGVGQAHHSGRDREPEAMGARHVLEAGWRNA